MQFPFNIERLNEAIEKSSLREDLEYMPSGLMEVMGKSGKNISGGQKARIALARAIYYEKEIFLIDEVAGSLDKINAFRVEESLLENDNITVIYISHHLDDDTLKKFDKVYYL